MVKVHVKKGSKVARFRNRNKLSFHDAMQGLMERLKLQDEQEFPILIFTNALIFSSAEVRELMAEKGVQEAIYRLKAV